MEVTEKQKERIAELSEETLLSRREAEAWVLYVENPQKPNPWKGTVARELGIAKHTLDTYLDRAYKKREEAYRTVQELGKPEAVE